MKKPCQNQSDYKVLGSIGDTRPHTDRKGKITIEGLVADAEIDPSCVKTLGPDIFQDGYFSAFDTLVSTCEKNGIDINHQFNPDLKTHVIDSINGEKNWWYAASYHGGGRRGEEPIHRMDCLPYKDWMVIRVYQVPGSRVDEIHAAFRAEVKRLDANGGKVVIPEVSIETADSNLDFDNLEVRPHGLRSDMFKKDVITAADVMLMLAVNGKLSLDVTGLEHIGRAVIQDYYFTRFNDMKAEGRAGFTYELGEQRFAGVRLADGRRFGNNDIHMSADIRVIVCPEYVKWHWTDLSSRRDRH